MVTKLGRGITRKSLSRHRFLVNCKITPKRKQTFYLT